MKYLLKNARFLDGSEGSLFVEGAAVTYVGEASGAPTGAERTIDCGGNLLIPGLYNLHTHAAMQFIRGYGEDLPLQDWLKTKVYPAEDRLTKDMAGWACRLAMAEMIRGGIVSFSDMYFYSDVLAEAVLESGMKANVARSLVSFEPGMRAFGDRRFEEARALVRDYQNAGDGRLKIEMSLHAEYTNVESYIRDVADYTLSHGLRMHVHLSETKQEHEACLARHGKTPAAYFSSLGVFQSPTIAAHCVFCGEEDMALLAKQGVTAVHNPCSNLKLGSGIMPLSHFAAHGVNLALGTDGACSNNALDLFREMYVASLLAKGTTGDPTAGSADLILKMATENGALGQGRSRCGKLARGYAADLVLVDLDTVNNIPSYDDRYTLLYAASSRDVLLTMADGKILYEKGEYTTLDVEKIKAEMKHICHF